MFVERSIEAKIAKPAKKNKSVLKVCLITHLRLVDITTITYLSALSFLLIFFHQGVENWPLFVLGNFAFIGALVFYIRFSDRKSSNILTFFRDCYPFFIFTFVFKETALVVNIFKSRFD